MEQNNFQQGTYYHQQGSGPPTPTQDELPDEPSSSGEPLAGKYPVDNHDNCKSLYEDFEDISDAEISSDVGDEDVTNFIDMVDVAIGEQSTEDGTWQNELENILGDEPPMLEQMIACYGRLRDCVLLCISVVNET